MNNSNPLSRLSQMFSRLGVDPTTLRDLADRNLARVSLRAFLRQSFPVLKRNPNARLSDDWYFGALAEHGEAFLSGQLRRLVVTTPPGTYKSRTFLVALCAWGWIHYPDKRFLCGTNDATLGLELSRDCRALIGSSWYQTAFDPKWQISVDKDTEHLFTNTAGGQRQVVSVGSTVTGKKATDLLLDDVHDAEQVHSPTVIESDCRWFYDAFYDRQDDFTKSGILVVGHRLRRNDLESRLIADGWPELRLVERMEDRLRKTFPLGGNDPRKVGEYLRPARFGPEQEREVRQTSEPNWQAKHQADPQSAGGTMFPADKLPPHRPWAAAGLQAVRFWDTAASTQETASYTSGVLIGKTTDGRWQIVNVTRGRWGYAQRDDVILRTAQEDSRRNGVNVQAVVIEHPGGSGGLQTAQILTAKLAGFYVVIQSTSGRGDKVHKAGPLSGQWNAGNVELIDDGTWDVRGFVQRMESFPGLNEKDDTDAAAGGFNFLASGNVAGDVEPATGSSGAAAIDALPEGTMSDNAYATGRSLRTQRF